jgi:hypothetical protein
MPEVFCLSSNPEETLKMLKTIHRNVLGKADSYARRKKKKALKGKPISEFYDFATMRYISPAAALVLAAIFERAKFITGAKLHTVNEDTWDPGVKSTLRSLGFHELLDMRKGDAVVSPPEVVVQRFISGSHAQGEPVGKLQEALAGLLPHDLAEKLRDAEPYGGMFEAILNSHSWAYPEEYIWDITPLRNWWLTGAVDVAAGRVTVIVYDQGVSIPYSLPHWEHWGQLERRVRRFLSRTGIGTSPGDASNDALAIRLAMTISKSKTNLPQHGKGLHTMVEVAQRARHGTLKILSRNGEYVWETGKRPKTATYRNPIVGTLVEWTLDL